MKAECLVMFTLPPALQHRDYRRLWLGMLGSSFGTQMVSVAVGWQVYAIHRSAFDLGLIGLAEFLPLLLLALPAGQLADRLPRTLIAAPQLRRGRRRRAAPRRHPRRRHQLWAVPRPRRATGAASAIGSPAGRSLTPEIVPTELLAGRARPSLHCRPGGERRRPGARRAPLPVPARGGLRGGALLLASRGARC